MENVTLRASELGDVAAVPLLSSAVLLGGVYANMKACVCVCKRTRKHACMCARAIGFHTYVAANGLAVAWRCANANISACAELTNTCVRKRVGTSAYVITCKPKVVSTTLAF